MYYATKYESPLGEIMIASDEENIIGLWIEGQKYFEDMGEIEATVQVKKEGFISDQEEQSQQAQEVLKKARDWLDRYFNREAPAISELSLAPIGSEFRQMVWQFLCEIPSGETTTYGEIARKVAARTGKKTMSAQAVGGAVGHNPISIIIPCHRVVGTNGSLTGYAGGIDKKIALLQLEGVDTDRFSVPKKGTAL